MITKMLCRIGIHKNKRYLFTSSKPLEYGIKVVYDLYECPHCQKNIEKSRTSFYEYPKKTTTAISINQFLTEQYSSSDKLNYYKRNN